MTKRKLGRLVIFEGPDCGGKSTVMNEFKKRMQGDNETVHHGPMLKISAEQLPRFYVESMFSLFHGDVNLLMDRCWLSEPIYGSAFRGGANRIDYIERRHLERMALRHGAVVVLCLPPWEVVKEKWLERKQANAEAEYLDKLDQLAVVWNHYDSLESITDLPVVRYDYTQNGHQIDKLIAKTTWASDGVHANAWMRTAGSASPKVILVGEAPSEPTSQDTMWQFPFCSFGGGSSEWVTTHLAKAGIPERDLYWVNASDSLFHLQDMWQVPIIALGVKAAEAVAKVFDGKKPDAVVNHPQYHRRFKGAEAYDLANTILKFTK